MKIYSHDAGHMTKMAAMPIYGKNPFKNLIQNQWTDFHETLSVGFVTRVHHGLFKIMTLC